MMFFLSRWPAGWSRQSRCSLAIALGVVLLLLLMCFIDIPLSRMPEPIAENAELFAEGSRITVYLTLVSGVAGLVLGVLGALGRLSRIPPIRWIASFYIWVIRGTPLLVQLFIIYYGLPEIGLQLDPLPAAIIGFSLNTAAYTCETLRAAIAQIDAGQWEAAASLGMNRRQTLRRIIVPQAARTALPPLGNSFIALVKDTSLAATIQVPELLRQSQLITARTFEVFAMYISAALIYWAIASILSALQARLERHTNRSEAPESGG